MIVVRGLRIAAVTLGCWAGWPVPVWATLTRDLYMVRCRVYGHRIQGR